MRASDLANPFRILLHICHIDKKRTAWFRQLFSLVPSITQINREGAVAVALRALMNHHSYGRIKSEPGN